MDEFPAIMFASIRERAKAPNLYSYTRLGILRDREDGPRMLPMIENLAEEFESFLFDSDFTTRFAHHFANVANETWLSLEMAYLFNTRQDAIAATGWSAVLEQKRVDVTLLPPSAAKDAGHSQTPKFIELKLVGTNWWNSNWRDAAKDLIGEQARKHIKDKPIATYSVCLLYNNLSEGLESRRAATTQKYEGYMNLVPTTRGWFDPGVDSLQFYLERSSRLHRLRWAQSVGTRWPTGFEADVRLIWLSRGPE